MATTVHEEPRGTLRQVAALVQAMGLVYVVGLGMVAFGAAVDLTLRGATELVSWIAGLIQ